MAIWKSSNIFIEEVAIKMLHIVMYVQNFKKDICIFCPLFFLKKITKMDIYINACTTDFKRLGGRGGRSTCCFEMLGIYNKPDISANNIVTLPDKLSFHIKEHHIGDPSWYIIFSDSVKQSRWTEERYLWERTKWACLHLAEEIPMLLLLAQLAVQVGNVIGMVHHHHSRISIL